MSNGIELVHDGAWLTIWLDRPEARNAMSAGMIDALIASFENAADDASIRGITVRGRGEVFCAGGDLKEFRSALQGKNSHADAVAANRRAGELFGLAARLPKPLVAVLDGAAIAGGLGLACTADVVIATRRTRFALTETRLGIPPAQIAAHIVHRIGAAKARRLMLTATSFRGDEAAQLGIVDFVVDPAELDQREQQIRSDVLACAPNANAVTKALIASAMVLEPDAFVERAAHDFADCLLSAEGKEGVAAFVEKRTPHWHQGGGE